MGQQRPKSSNSIMIIIILVLVFAIILACLFLFSMVNDLTTTTSKTNEADESNETLVAFERRLEEMERENTELRNENIRLNKNNVISENNTNPPNDPNIDVNVDVGVDANVDVNVESNASVSTTNMKNEAETPKAAISPDTFIEQSPEPIIEIPPKQTPEPIANQTVKLVDMEYFTRNIDAKYSPNLHGEWYISDGQIELNTSDKMDNFIGLIQKPTYTLAITAHITLDQETVNGTIEYYLNSQYKDFSGILCLISDYKSTRRLGNITIWGDDVELYSSTDISGGYIPEEFTVDVTNITVLKITIEYAKNEVDASCIGIAEAILNK